MTTGRRGRERGGPQLDAVPSFISLVPFHTRPTIKRIPDGLAGGPLRCQRRPRRRRRRRCRPGRSGGSGGSLVKANLVLIQSIWRRERNNLNAARAEGGREERESSLSSVAPRSFARKDQLVQSDPVPMSVNGHYTVWTLQMTDPPRTRVSAMPPVSSCPRRLTSSTTITSGSSNNNKRSIITAATMVPVAAGSSTIPRQRQPLPPPLAWHLTT